MNDLCSGNNCNKWRSPVGKRTCSVPPSNPGTPRLQRLLGAPRRDNNLCRQLLPSLHQSAFSSESLNPHITGSQSFSLWRTESRPGVCTGIMKGPSRPRRRLITLLPSERCYRSIRAQSPRLNKIEARWRQIRRPRPAGSASAAASCERMQHVRYFSMKWSETFLCVAFDLIPSTFRNPRVLRQQLLLILKVRAFGGAAFYYDGPDLWKCLPAEREGHWKRFVFRSKLVTHLFNRAFHYITYFWLFFFIFKMLIIFW